MAVVSKRLPLLRRNPVSQANIIITCNKKAQHSRILNAFSFEMGFLQYQLLLLYKPILKTYIGGIKLENTVKKVI
jgi:hypothetical protein